MRVSIDGAGRLVVPKAMRQRLGIHGPSELEISEVDGAIEITPRTLESKVEWRDGDPVIVPLEPGPPLTADEVRRQLERSRR